MTRRLAAAALFAAVAATAVPAQAHPVLCVQASAYALRYYTSLPKICLPYAVASDTDAAR